VDPLLANGYRLSMTASSLFTKILGLPVGIDRDNTFEIFVGNNRLGLFSPGTVIDFVALLGAGVQSFVILGIDPAIDETDAEGFPVQLEFSTPTADFTMTPIHFRSVGTRCADAVTCPSCPAVGLEPIGDALLGNLAFGLQLHDAPAGGLGVAIASV